MAGAGGAGLPPAVLAMMAQRLDGQARGPLKAAAERITATYRAGGHSDRAITSDIDGLAYAVARMPATYAAVTQVLRRARDEAGLRAPASLLDLGAGPGTASLAASEVWPSLAAISLIDGNAVMRRFAETALAAAGLQARVIAGDVLRPLPSEASAELVLASYVLAELSLEQAQRLVGVALQHATAHLILIEPGTTHGFERLRAARSWITGAGWHLLAPCPHQNACPLAADDWCHFSVRLARSRDHRQIKDVDAPYEDEPYSYLIASRTPGTATPPARVLRPPNISKGEVTVRICGAQGLAEKRISRRSKSAYKAASDLDAGDVYVPE